MSSSGLIFAMIVGAWAAYLVPMWLRRQDELNEARPTERFSTAIRLLTRRRASEESAEGETPEPAADDAVPAADAHPDVEADVRAFAEPVAADHPAPAPAPAAAPAPSGRAKVLARRRRTTMVLLLAFTLGGIVTLTAGTRFVWLPAIPAVLLTAYVVHVRRQERHRYAVALDRRRAEEAARRLRQRTQASTAARPEKPSKAIVEQTDHAEWVDQQRRRAPALDDEPQSWDPAPVPLPTYVNAPVAPRTNRGIDLEAPDTWSAARSTTAATPNPTATPQPGPQRTPLFDQYADPDDDRHRRASGE
ncbi:divisome protein SepX/GlpR [Streptomyces millisiae]|uniref:divisome protein SepX/GlpR n=1 Tax=Streptomyces millisiae TaxID=3075542 RepID=UPI00374E025E